MKNNFVVIRKVKMLDNIEISLYDRKGNYLGLISIWHHLKDIQIGLITNSYKTDLKELLNEPKHKHFEIINKYKNK